MRSFLTVKRSPTSTTHVVAILSLIALQINWKKSVLQVVTTRWQPMKDTTSTTAPLPFPLPTDDCRR